MEKQLIKYSKTKQNYRVQLYNLKQILLFSPHFFLTNEMAFLDPWLYVWLPGTTAPHPNVQCSLSLRLRRLCSCHLVHNPKKKKGFHN